MVEGHAGERRLCGKYDLGSGFTELSIALGSLVVGSGDEDVGSAVVARVDVRLVGRGVDVRRACASLAQVAG